MNAASSHPIRESSISVAVRVRPFTANEETKLVKPDTEQFFVGDGSLASNNSNENSGAQPNAKKSTLFNPRGIRKIVNVVDDKMLIFDPPETNPLCTMQNNAFPNSSQRPRIREYRFVFDKLFDSAASQNDIYNDTTKPLLDSILDGFNSTVFAYGATGCGKTHTILGTPEDPGVIFLTMKELFERIDELSDKKVFDVSLSFLEIYNETIRDLLNPETHFKKLILREDANKKISVSNLSSHKPNNVEEVMELILLGNQNRTSSPTEANATSSRSHAVLQINVVQKNRTADISEEHTYATLSIIDLAGSERAAATKNRGARLNEGANINRSLLALGNCINALCDPRRRNHIPYRDSKLTRLLKFSLGGNCKTVMIVCISPLSQHYDETLNTLKYADRAKEIKTKLVRNQHNLDRHVGSYLKMITEQKQEIHELRNRELRIIENAIHKQNTINNKCMSSMLESIENIKKSVNNHQQEKWQKYYLLAKRKLLLSQQADISSLSESLAEVVNINEQRSLQSNISSLSFQVDQYNNKINQQIINLETQYDTPCEIDNIFNHSITYTLKKLKELENWNDQLTIVFESLIESIKSSLEKDILFNSSILFDYLLGESKQFNFLPTGIADLLLVCSNYEENFEDNLYNVIDKLIQSLESMNNSDYDSAIETYTSSFIQQQFKEPEDRFGDAQDTEEDIDHTVIEHNLNSTNHDDFEDIENKPTPSSRQTSNSHLKVRDTKRGSTSPLRASPPRNVKKSISKKSQPSTVSQSAKTSPLRSSKYNRKVRRDISSNNNYNTNNNDISIVESDISMDDSTMQQGEKQNNDHDDSPIDSTNVPDRSNILDELDFKFDPSLDSPPITKLLQERRNTNLMTDLVNNNNDSHINHTNKSANPRFQSLTNKKLPTSDDNDSLLKLPLLNKQASTKIISDRENFKSQQSYIPGPNNNYKSALLSEPSRVINSFGELNHETRNIGSGGSEKVD